MAQILIIEDEEKLQLVMQKYLEAEGHQVQILSEGTQAVHIVKETDPDLILLDIMLPGKSGIDICKEVRSFSNVPIIMVTAKVDEIDLLLGLELGADDYINKPFSPRAVVARVKALLRRVSPTAHDSLVDTDKTSTQDNSSDLKLDSSCYQASVDGQDLELTPVEFRILATLYGSPTRIFNRDQLIEHMYDDHRTVSDRTVDSHIANLRKKLKRIRPELEWIQPVYGIGYRFSE